MLDRKHEPAAGGEPVVDPLGDDIEVPDVVQRQRAYHNTEFTTAKVDVFDRRPAVLDSPDCRSRPCACKHSLGQVHSHDRRAPCWRAYRQCQPKPQPRSTSPVPKIRKQRPKTRPLLRAVQTLCQRGMLQYFAKNSGLSYIFCFMQDFSLIIGYAQPERPVGGQTQSPADDRHSNRRQSFCSVSFHFLPPQEQASQRGFFPESCDYRSAFLTMLATSASSTPSKRQASLSMVIPLVPL